MGEVIFMTQITLSILQKDKERTHTRLEYFFCATAGAENHFFRKPETYNAFTLVLILVSMD